MSVSYHLGEFPPRNINWEALAPYLANASDALARYDSFLGIIPNPEILIAPMMMQEAVTSSRIEGTQATVGDVLEFNAGNTDVSPNKRDDIREVVNYQVAVETAERMMRDMPLCGRVMRYAHEILLSGVRGEMKSPGRYRTDQNWIGVSGSRIEDARYIPAPPGALEGCMLAWETFVNRDDLPSLYKTAVAHAEFESIHPFCDGNGRIGRMLVPLMMWKDGLLTNPCFYLSEFFDRCNSEYQDRLLAVSSEGDWTGWCQFFLRAVRDQAVENNKRVHGMYALNEDLKRRLAEKSGSAHASIVIDKLFEKAIFSRSEFVKIDGMDPQTVRRMLGILEKEGVIRTIRRGRGRTSSIMVFPELLSLTQE